MDYDLVFPLDMESGYRYADDQWIGFWACRQSCAQLHHGIDMMAPKMTPVYAVADGTVSWLGSNCCSVFIRHDDGWQSWYIHLNNGTVGTDDGLGWGIADGITRGTRVRAGQVIGWVGDSGNAEATAPHLHFELLDAEGTVVNPYQSLRVAEARGHLVCEGAMATILGTDGPDEIIGTDGDDVIHAGAGDDHVHGGGGNDLICGGEGDDDLSGGEGNDRVLGGPGDDGLFGGVGNDRLFGGPGFDLLSGGKGRDILRGEAEGDLLRGGPGPDEIFPGDGDDTALGGAGADRLHAAAGANELRGGSGRDEVVYRRATVGVVVDLAAGTGSGDGSETLSAIEIVIGSRHDDRITGSDRGNRIRGGGGSDIIAGGDGRDRLSGGSGDDTLSGDVGDDRLIGGADADHVDGGVGTDNCSGEKMIDCEG